MGLLSAMALGAATGYALSKLPDVDVDFSRSDDGGFAVDVYTNGYKEIEENLEREDKFWMYRDIDSLIEYRRNGRKGRRHGKR